MKKFILCVALLMATIAATAQHNYDSGHKYGLFSNLDVGISGQYAHNFADKQGNWGADLRVTKRIGDHWRLRGLVDVNGFVNNGFDRYAKGLVGISFDALPFYTFFDYGFNWNRSSQSQFGLAGDAGFALVSYGVDSTRLVIVGNGMTDNDAPLDQKVLVRKAIQ